MVYISYCYNDKYHSDDAFEIPCTYVDPFSMDIDMLIELIVYKVSVAA